MKPSSKIYMGITGGALVTVGIICLAKPFATLYTMATIIGAMIILSGFTTLLTWLRTRSYMPTGNILLSAILQLILGMMLINHKSIIVTTIPVLFAGWMLIEGVVLAIRSFDFRQAGSRIWWMLCLLGVFASVMGFEAIKQPMEIGSSLISTFLGLGFIALGVIDLTALFGINKLSKRRYTWVEEERGIDEQ